MIIGNSYQYRVKNVHPIFFTKFIKLWCFYGDSVFGVVLTFTSFERITPNHTLFLRNNISLGSLCVLAYCSCTSHCLLKLIQAIIQNYIYFINNNKILLLFYSWLLIMEHCKPYQCSDIISNYVLYNVNTCCLYCRQCC